MASVWAIEQGKYANYHVVGVFSTKAAADMVAAVVAAAINGESHVAEWPLDPGVEEMRAGQTFYRLLMSRDGDVRELAPSDRPYGASGFYGWGVGGWQGGSFWGRDEAHAVHVANEHRARLMAAGEWQ